MTFVEFGGIRLETLPGLVMSPRPTSMALVDRVVAHVAGREAVVVDVGTGSGAIAIAIARAAPSAVVWATDVSGDAVALAEENAARCGVADRLRVQRGDLLDPVPGRIDVVVANLPYLPRRERTLHPDLLGEPTDSVFTDGDGLDVYRRLVRVAETRLSADGLLVVQLRGRVLEARAGAVEALGLGRAA